ncbi:unnamed protein product [Chironomus riparius]|uniref:Protein kinase domain-containing protein n=1 Tax=Chironomus riparius TaxID=315576 RepID=A0A9N9WWF1_9DIPT|nr:unnamed protein product [Chironomus riparius]
MNDVQIDWNDVYPEYTGSDLRSLQDHEDCQIVRGVKFNTNSKEDESNYGSNYYSGIETVTKEKFVISLKPFTNQTDASQIKNNLKQSYHLISQCITSVLEIRSHKIGDNHVHIFYKFYNFTFRNYIQGESASKNFKYLLKKLFKAVDSIHNKEIIIGNILLDNIAIVNENNKLKPKIFNLSMAESSADQEMYTKDKRDVGILILSIIVGDEDARAIAKKFQNVDTRDEKFNLIYEKVKNVSWIPRTNIKIFADLIACLLNVKPSNSLAEFKNHAFFYNREKTLEYLSAVNGRLNLSQDERSKNSKKADDVKNRKDVLNKILPNNLEVCKKLVDYFGGFEPKDATLAERCREARNKEVHLEDDTDSECEIEAEDSDKNGEAATNSIQAVEFESEFNITSCDKSRQTENSNDCKKKPKAHKKDPEKWKIFSKILLKKGGAINLHLEVDENFIYDLFNSVRILAFNPNIRRFYIDSFLFDDPQSRFNDILTEIKLDESKNKTDDAEKTNEQSKNIANKAPIKPAPSRSSDEQNEKIRMQDVCEKAIKQTTSTNKPKKKNKPTGVSK